uniref:26S proteasome non-ATPase regulatory subunit 1 homolog n=1 Tax=Tetraselmis sp. GSL018 TaxID=582737 RepID=A0A061QUJ8_9CHLO
MPGAYSSASGLLALLEEDDDALRVHALKQLNEVVHEHWFQISSSISAVEGLFEDEEFSHRQLAALLASKVFYHLGELDDALTYALGADLLFDINEKSEYVQTLLARAIDQYVELRVKSGEGEEGAAIDPRLEAIVERMMERCIADHQFEQAVGVAIECRRLDKLEEAVTRCPEMEEIVTYSLNICKNHIMNLEFRQQVLRLIIKLYESVENPDWINICMCLMMLDDHKEVAKILRKLLEGSEDDALLAYQVCFDLFENEMQSFSMKVRLEMEAHVRSISAAAAPEAPAAEESAAAAADGAQDMEAEAAGQAAEARPPPQDTPEVAQYKERFERLRSIITGKTPINLYLEFLYSHNHSDLQILKNIKAAIEPRNSVCHSTTIVANALMHCGTTIDTFLRENLEWLSRATNWAKFTVTAGLGVIHKGHLSQGKALMEPYLPRHGVASPYSEGGALYALGLIHANHGEDIRRFLLDSLRQTDDECIQHGGCLGLGLAGMGTGDEELFEDIKGILYTDSAVAGEAAGIAMGLLEAGSATEKCMEMLHYAHDTQHEKIIRGLAIGLALIMFGREEMSDAIVEEMTHDQDPILRYGGMFVIGMAYTGTSNNAAIQKLLHFAVSDVSNDVRRAAVMCLGFVLAASPHKCPAIVSLLAESYNPHMRYGAAMAIAIACAGTGMREAVALLEPMLSDASDFVRQGAVLGMALVQMQQPEEQVSSFRRHLDKVINDKHEDTLCKMGAILATGILDAGGRNVTVSLRSHNGQFKMTSAVGLAVFMQYWYWYPLSYFISLSFQPTALVGLNKDLQMVKFDLTSNARPSLFAYPPPLSTATATTITRAPTAVLSTTAKRKKKDAEKRKKAGEAAAMEVDEQKPEGHEEGPEDAEAEEEEKKAPPKKEPEPTSETLSNPCRVVRSQEQYIQFDSGCRYVPVKKNCGSGIMLFKDTKPEQPQQLVLQEAPGEELSQGGTVSGAADRSAEDAAGDEPAPPEAFDYPIG